MQSVLILEDHEQMAEWLAELVRDTFSDVRIHRATTLGQALEMARRKRFSVALIDIGLPDGSGIDLIGDLISGDENDCYPVVTTIYDDDKHLFAALQAGARGYLLKDQPRERLGEQLLGILRGDPPLSPSVARRMLRFFQPPRDDSPQPHLTQRETEVLRLLARGARRNDIATALEISAHTVAGHVKTIYRKLNISGRAEAALQAVKLGLVDRHE